MDHGDSQSSGGILAAIKQVIQEYEGTQDFLSKMNSLGFELVSNDRTGALMSGPDGNIMFAVLPSFDPDRIFTLVAQLGDDGPQTLVSEGEVVTVR